MLSTLLLISSVFLLAGADMAQPKALETTPKPEWVETLPNAVGLQRSSESPGVCSPKVGHLLLVSPVSDN